MAKKDLARKAINAASYKTPYGMSAAAGMIPVGAGYKYLKYRQQAKRNV